MAQRPIWRGHLRLALVSCPVALYSARHERGAIKFNLINPVTGNRIKMVSQDAATGEEVARRDTVKGYEFKKDHYLLLTDEDFDSVKVDSSSTMTVEKFVDVGSIDPVYYDASYYLAPDGKGSDDVYAVLREAVLSTGKVALSRVVISQRERTVAVRPIYGGLVLHTLNEERDLNAAAPLFEDVRKVKVDPEMVKLAVQLVDRQSGTYDPADLEDRYETRLRAMLDAKLKGEGVDLPSAVPDVRDNVIDLMVALKKSLGQGSAPARAGLPVPPADTAAKPSDRAASGSKRAKTPSPDELRRQPTFKLPITGGQKEATPKTAAATPKTAAKAGAPPQAAEPTMRGRRKA